MQVLKQGRSYRIIPPDSIITTLDQGIYDISQDMRGMYLERREDNKFPLPDRIYGDIEKFVQRVYHKFDEQDKNLGILLNGEKGSGKSLTATNICNHMGLPILMTNKLYPELYDFLIEFKTPFILFIDEFDKIYREEKAQETILSLLSGTTTTKIMVILTSNNLHNISDYLINRPGRIHYLLNYIGITEENIREIGEDLLHDITKVDILIQLYHIVGKVNIDLIQAVIDEINLFQINDIEDIFKFMNVSPEQDKFQIKAIHKNKKWFAYFSDVNPILQYSLSINEFWVDKKGAYVYDKDTKDSEELIITNKPLKDCNVEIKEDGYVITTDDVTLVYTRPPSGASFYRKIF